MRVPENLVDNDTHNRFLLELRSGSAVSDSYHRDDHNIVSFSATMKYITCELKNIQITNIYSSHCVAHTVNIE